MLKITDLTRLAEALSGIELIQEIDQLKSEVNSHRPISKEIQDRIFQKFRLEWNYNSNAIEGNNLTYGETVALIMHGVTAKGKPLKDHLDVKGHNKGINLLLDIVKSERDFTQNDIRSLHEIILVESYSSKTVTLDGIPATRKIQIGQYKTVPNHVKTVTGEMHYYATPEETPILMDELMNWYEQAKINDKIHPFITASLFHYRFVAIHPFDDGNGRMTRILMNLILMRNQYPPIVVPLKLREQYYGVLSEADSEDYLPMIEYFGQLLKHSIGIQLKGIKGESIAEPDDIDKKIELFRKSLDKKLVQQSRSAEIIKGIFSISLISFFDKLSEKLSKISDLFLDFEINLGLYGKTKNNKRVSQTLTKADLSDVNFSDFHIKKIEIEIELSKFKNTKNSFSIYDNSFIYFKDLEYKLESGNTANQKFSIKKLYSDFLSEEEKNEIITSIIQNIIEKINNSIEKDSN